MNLDSVFFIIFIVGFYSMLLEAIGNPLWHSSNNKQLDTTAILSFYVSFICRLIIKREGITEKKLEGDTQSIKAMNLAILWDSIQPYLFKYKVFFCGYCMSTWTAIILLPIWIALYNTKGFLYFGFHIFLNQFLKQSK